MYQYKVYEGLYILGGTFVFIMSLFSGIHYVIFEEKLYIKTWFITSFCLDIIDIASVKRSYNLFDVPTNTTASFKKLCLQLENSTNFSTVLVSPVREQEFIDELKTINPDITVDIPDSGVWHIQDWDI
jgi:hypothetical protein